MATPCTIYATAHGIPIGTKFTVTTTGTLPTPMAETTEYYVITAGYSANSFRFALEREGTAFATTDAGSGVMTIHSVDSDPQVGLDWSNDGGHTWSNRYYVSIGKTGEYTKRSIWRRLGRSRDRIFRITFSEPVKFVFIAAYADVEALLN